MGVADIVLEKYWDGSFPIEPIAIAESVGIRVSSDRLSDCSGFVHMNDDGVSTITYNEFDSPVRQRFTIAHEIGHVLLGHMTNGSKEFRDGPMQFSLGTRDYKESDANRFAAELLMPEKFVRLWFSKMRGSDLGDAARMFYVSEAALYYRLVNLGLVQP